jgi:hypothetical protein
LRRHASCAKCVIVGKHVLTTAALFSSGKPSSLSV